MAEPAATIVDADRFEEATEHAIETCRGDPRSAVKSLLIVIDFLEHELELAQAASSSGYLRRNSESVKRVELAERAATGGLQKPEQL